MTASTAPGWGLTSVWGTRLQAAREGILRLSGGILHILATVAVARSLSPDGTGIYYKGSVIAFGLAALLRNKYEFYGSPYIAANMARSVGIPVSTLVLGLSKRLLIRAAVICGILLVITSDIDIFEPHLRPYLQTFLPFVLSIPLLALSTMLSNFLRAANRAVLNVVTVTFSVNAALLAAAVFGGDYISLELFSWTFLGGAFLAAGIASFFAWNVFRGCCETAAAPTQTRAEMWGEVHQAVAANAGTARAHAALIWGPLCLLAVLVDAPEFALCAVAARTAQAVDFLLPSLNFIACNETSILPGPCRSDRRAAWSNALALAAIAASILVAIFVVATPAILSLFGPPYTQMTALFTVLLAAQWVNGTGRPGMRFFVTHWDLPKGQRMVEIAAVCAVLVCAVGVTHYGAMAAAVAILTGSIVINGQVTARMLSEAKP